MNSPAKEQTAHFGSHSEAATRLSGRHVNYAGQAALLLGLVELIEGAYLLTPRGKELAKTTPESEAERRLLSAAVRQSRPLQRLAPGLLSNPAPRKSDLVVRLQRQAGLGKATAEHRAAMLLKWRKRLLQQELEFGRGKMWRRVGIKNLGMRGLVARIGTTTQLEREPSPMDERTPPREPAAGQEAAAAAAEERR